MFGIFKLSNWPFVIKLGLAPVIALAAMAGIVSVGLNGVQAQSQSLTRVVDHAVRGNGLLVSAQRDIQGVNGGIYRILSLQAAKTANLNAVARLQALGAKVDAAEAALSQYQKNWASPGDKARVGKLVQDVKKYKGALEFVTQMLEIDFNSAVSFLAPFDKNYDELNREIASITAAGERMSAQQEEEARAVAADTRHIFMLVGWLAALLVSAIGIVMTWGTTRSIRAIAGSTRDLAGGNMDIDVESLARRDELGAIVQSLEVFRQTAIIARDRTEQAERSAKEAEQAIGGVGAALEKLARGDLTWRIDAAFTGPFVKLKDDFNAAVHQLEDTMGRILANADGINAGALEISSAAEDFSRRSERQSGDLERTSAALEEITATVKTTAHNAKEASGIVSTTQKAAEQGTAVVATAIAAMDRIEDSSKRITDIIGVIDEIAFQTNLLALNAGVEAARAGDAGRGFAVVASEVRALAQRSSEAGKEIKKLIQASSEHVGSGVDHVRESGRTFKSIADQIHRINALVSEMSHAAQQQSTGIDEVNQSLIQVGRVTQQNTAMVEQSTAASHQLASDTSELIDMVSMFKVTRHDDARAALAGMTSEAA